MSRYYQLFLTNLIVYTTFCAHFTASHSDMVRVEQLRNRRVNDDVGKLLPDLSRKSQSYVIPRSQ